MTALTFRGGLFILKYAKFHYTYLGELKRFAFRVLMQEQALTVLKLLTDGEYFHTA